MAKKQNSFLLLISLLAISSVASAYLCCGDLPSYRDEQYYIVCGLRYVNGSPPVLCNFEHPPLAKYVIGFSYRLGFSRPLFTALYIVSALLLFLISLRLFNDFGVSLFSSLILFFDTLFYNVHRFLLLDPIAIVFSLASLYLSLRGSYALSGTFAGFATASKFSSAPTVVISMLVASSSSPSSAWVYILLALVSYVSTYAMDFELGLETIARHHIDMIRYMGSVHSFSYPLAAIGFLKLLTRVEVWLERPPITATISFVNGTWRIPNITLTGAGMPWARLVVIDVGMGSIAWFIAMPMLIYNTYRAIVYGERSLRVAVLWGWASLLNVVAGPIDWYYANVLPALYTNIGIGMRNLLKGRFKPVATAFVVAQAALFYATLAGFLPYKIEFAIG